MNKARTLVFSQRHIHDALFRCPLYELEDLVCQIDSAEILAPRTGNNFNFHYQMSKRVAWHLPVRLNPGIPPTELKQEYDLFFAACGSPVDLLIVDTVKNRKDTCKTSVCLLDELWMTEMSKCKYFLQILSDFDFVMPYYSQGVTALNKMTGCKTVFLPPGIDALRFCPYPDPPRRVIDVYSAGRRSSVTHRKLLATAAERQMFYLYDTISGSRAIDTSEHRALFANIAKRSRYFIVNPALIDRIDIRGDQSEIGYRYFEGAASGAIMLGERPKNRDFDSLFDWPDAVIDLPFGSDRIDTVIAELDAQPDRQHRIRQTNIVQALRRHDWAYRWDTVLQNVSLPPLPGLIERKDRLTTFADTLQSVQSRQVVSGA